MFFLKNVNNIYEQASTDGMPVSCFIPPRTDVFYVSRRVFFLFHLCTSGGVGLAVAEDVEDTIAENFPRICDL